MVYTYINFPVTISVFVTEFLFASLVFEWFDIVETQENTLKIRS